MPSASHGTSNSSGAIVTMQPTEGRLQDDERGMVVREPHLSIFQPRKLLRQRSSSCARLGAGKLSPPEAWRVIHVYYYYTPLPQLATISLRSTLRVELPLVLWCCSFIQLGPLRQAPREVPWLALWQPCTHACTCAYTCSLAAMMSGVGPNEISQSSMQVIIHGSSVPTRSLSRALLFCWELPSTFSRPGHLAKGL